LRYRHRGPSACTYLVQFARATTKPTKCSVDTKQAQTSYKTVRYKATVRVRAKKRVHVNGTWVTRSVWVRRTVWKTKRAPVTTYVTVPESYWESYLQYAWGVLAITHEASHLHGDMGVLVPPGYVNAGQWAGYADYEARAECHGMQYIAYAARQLGDTADDAQDIAQFYFDIYYPTEKGVVVRGNTYWSADCYAGGPLDLTPNDGVWP
jgi:hypothetical protein